MIVRQLASCETLKTGKIKILRALRILTMTILGNYKDNSQRSMSNIGVILGIIKWNQPKKDFKVPHVFKGLFFGPFQDILLRK